MLILILNLCERYTGYWNFYLSVFFHCCLALLMWQLSSMATPWFRCIDIWCILFNFLFCFRSRMNIDDINQRLKLITQLQILPTSQKSSINELFIWLANFSQWHKFWNGTLHQIKHLIIWLTMMNFKDFLIKFSLTNYILT